MSALGSRVPSPRKSETVSTTPRTLILTRLAAAGGATRSEVVSDLAPMFTHKLSPSDWKRTADREAAALMSAGLATERRGRLAATESGTAAIVRYLDLKGDAARSWAELRDIALVAKGLGLECETAARLKALARPDDLRALIVQKAFGLPQKKNQPAAKLRAQLAVAALERAFGNKIKAGFGKGSALSAKAGRLLAGQLSLQPREFASDAKLIAALAAEHVGASTSDFDSLRIAVLRRLGTEALESAKEAPQPPAKAVESVRRLPAAANDSGPAPLPAPKVVRPDLHEFARSVKVAAAARAQGWPGSRKAYISHVWQAIRAAEPRWALSEIEFKCMLAEAHRVGALVLANADLKSKGSMEELESSAVLYKNAVWHFVRVED